MQQQGYKGIDYFRVIAVLLVIAIHTSPLQCYNETADFILTRILARTAVPFFLMATGFFLLPRLMADGKHTVWAGFVKKTIVLYIIAMLIYLPLNIYAGHFANQSLSTLIKAVLFNGTFYHLWYLPASILGMLVVYQLTNWLSPKVLLLSVVGLYVIGLFGDSYYGLSAQVPFLQFFYSGIFSLFDYTRNGLFFAPLFIAMGGWLAHAKRPCQITHCTVGLVAATALLVFEALLLQKHGLQRHDSMYFMLIPCMYFLFQMLLLWQGTSKKHLRKFCMYAYIAHPLCIVLVRGLAKVTGSEVLLIDNSIIHFIAVVTITFICCAAIVLAPRLKINTAPSPTGRAWLEIDLANLNHNLSSLKNILPHHCGMMAVIKANAYGHGAVEIAKVLNKQGIEHFAVATLAEGITLRKHNVKGDILILGYTHPRDIQQLTRYNLTQTVVDYRYADMLNSYGKKVKVHIKIDTGMNRLGENYQQLQPIAKMYQHKNLVVCGTYTHLCAADSMHEPYVTFTKGQIENFYGVVAKLNGLGIDTKKLHIQSSYGVLNYPELHCDWARIGIALYGVLTNQGDQTRTQVDLRPLMSLKARVVLTKTVPQGQTVGYSNKFIAPQDSKIALISIGYADGVPRSLSCGRGDVLIKGQRAKIIGNICMDQLMVDITHIDGVETGDIATIIGQDGNEFIKAEQLAAQAGTITNELLSCIGERVKRVYYTSVDSSGRLV